MSGRSPYSLAALALASTLTLLSGCRPSAPKPAAAPPAPPTVPEPAQQPTTAPPGKPRLSAGAAGPVRLGMPADEVKKLGGRSVVSLDREVDGKPTSTLQIQRGTRAEMFADLKDGKVSRMVIVSPDYRTPEGAGLGTRASKLQQLYGAPKVKLDAGGAVCATFPKKPGLTFCFAPGSLKPPVKTWLDVVKRKLGVAVIIVGINRE